MKSKLFTDAVLKGKLTWNTKIAETYFLHSWIKVNQINIINSSNVDGVTLIVLGEGL